MRFKGHFVQVLSSAILFVSLVLLLSACGRGATATPTRPAATATPSIQSTVRPSPAAATPTPLPLQTTPQPISTSQPTANPTIVSNQGLLPPHRFVGTVVINGASAADDTVVTAIVDGAEVSKTTTIGGYYRIDVSQPQGQSFSGKTISFTVRGSAAPQTGLWEFGGVSEVNLAVAS